MNRTLFAVALLWAASAFAQSTSSVVTDGSGGANVTGHDRLNQVRSPGTGGGDVVGKKGIYVMTPAPTGTATPTATPTNTPTPTATNTSTPTPTNTP